MAGAFREVDEPNDYSASTVVPAVASDTEPAPPPVTAECNCPNAANGEHKSKCHVGWPLHIKASDSIAAAAMAQQLADETGLIVETHTQEYAPGDSEWRTLGHVADRGVRDLSKDIGSIAARIITPGIDDVLDAFESEEDVVNANRELLEGTPQTAEQYEKWRRLYGEIMNESNKRLRNRGVTLIVAVPNPNGLGCVFTGVDMERFKAAQSTGIFLPGGEDYEVVLTLPASERVDLHKAGREDFVRKFIDVVCEAVLEQKAQYERKQGMH